MTQPVLTTIGYEGASLEDFFATLRAAGVKRLIDVRELPLSRRKGFSKKALSAGLSNFGIEYAHLRGLGDPKPGRDAARRNEMDVFRKIFSQHLKTETAQVDLRIAAELAASGGSCLMCYERDHNNCHRSMVAAALSAKFSIKIRHLGVKSGLELDGSTIGGWSRKGTYTCEGASARR